MGNDLHALLQDQQFQAPCIPAPACTSYPFHPELQDLLKQFPVRSYEDQVKLQDPDKSSESL